VTADVLRMTEEEEAVEKALTHTRPVEAGSFEQRLSQCRALLLDVSFRPIDVLTWQRAITLELFDKAEVLAYYDLAVRSARQSHQLPAVLKVNVFVSPAKAGKITATRRNILIRDRYTCQYCNAAGESVDHVLPLSRGGDWSWTNLVCACNRCNAKKGARTPAEASMPLKRLPKEPNGRSAMYTRLGYNALTDSPPVEWEGYI
jgi:5-methylcytosine-specific restriction endonuclease McrA